VPAWRWDPASDPRSDLETAKNAKNTGMLATPQAWME